VRSQPVLGLRSRAMAEVEIIEEIEAVTRGFWRPSPGAVHPALRLLRAHDSKF